MLADAQATRAIEDALADVTPQDVEALAEAVGRAG